MWNICCNWLKHFRKSATVEPISTKTVVELPKITAEINIEKNELPLVISKQIPSEPLKEDEMENEKKYEFPTENGEVKINDELKIETTNDIMSTISEISDNDYRRTNCYVTFSDQGCSGAVDDDHSCSRCTFQRTSLTTCLFIRDSKSSERLNTKESSLFLQQYDFEWICSRVGLPLDMNFKCSIYKELSHGMNEKEYDDSLFLICFHRIMEIINNQNTNNSLLKGYTSILKRILPQMNEDERQHYLEVIDDMTGKGDWKEIDNYLLENRKLWLPVYLRVVLNDNFFWISHIQRSLLNCYENTNNGNTRFHLIKNVEFESEQLKEYGIIVSIEILGDFMFVSHSNGWLMVWRGWRHRSTPKKYRKTSYGKLIEVIDEINELQNDSLQSTNTISSEAQKLDQNIKGWECVERINLTSWFPDDKVVISHLSATSSLAEYYNYKFGTSILALQNDLIPTSLLAALTEVKYTNQRLFFWLPIFNNEIGKNLQNFHSDVFYCLKKNDKKNDSGFIEPVNMVNQSLMNKPIQIILDKSIDIIDMKLNEDYLILRIRNALKKSLCFQIYSIPNIIESLISHQNNNNNNIDNNIMNLAQFPLLQKIETQQKFLLFYYNYFMFTCHDASHESYQTSADKDNRLTIYNIKEGTPVLVLKKQAISTAATLLSKTNKSNNNNVSNKSNCTYKSVEIRSNETLPMEAKDLAFGIQTYLDKSPSNYFMGIHSGIFCLIDFSYRIKTLSVLHSTLKTLNRSKHKQYHSTLSNDNHNSEDDPSNLKNLVKQCTFIRGPITETMDENKSKMIFKIIDSHPTLIVIDERIDVFSNFI